jgi:hypothetical protein
LVATSTTIAWLFASVLDWLIEHDCVMPVVLMHLASFVTLATAATWTTAQLAVVHWKEFFPPAAATWTTGRDVDVHVQRIPGQRAPA